MIETKSKQPQPCPKIKPCSLICSTGPKAQFGSKLKKSAKINLFHIFVRSKLIIYDLYISFPLLLPKTSLTWLCDVKVQLVGVWKFPSQSVDRTKSNLQLMGYRDIEQSLAWLLYLKIELVSIVCSQCTTIPPSPWYWHLGIGICWQLGFQIKILSKITIGSLLLLSSGVYQVHMYYIWILKTLCLLLLVLSKILIISFSRIRDFPFFFTNLTNESRRDKGLLSPSLKPKGLA